MAYLIGCGRRPLGLLHKCNIRIKCCGCQVRGEPCVPPEFSDSLSIGCPGTDDAILYAYFAIKIDKNIYLFIIYLTKTDFCIILRLFYVTVCSR